MNRGGVGPLSLSTGDIEGARPAIYIGKKVVQSSGQGHATRQDSFGRKGSKEYWNFRTTGPKVHFPTGEHHHYSI